jgi:hypothetical protein
MGNANIGNERNVITPEARLYYVACRSLYSVLALPETHLNILTAGAPDMRLQSWATAYRDLAHWLVEEPDNASDRPAQDHLQERHRLLHEWDTASTPVLARNGKLVLSAAHSAYCEYSAIEERAWVYHYYCHWLHHTLARFHHLLNEPFLRATSFHQRYRDHASKFDAVAQQLHLEQMRLILTAVNGENRHQVEPLLVDLETHTHRLASEWYEMVITVGQTGTAA